MRSIYTCTTGMFSRALHAHHPVTTNLNTSPRFSPTIFYRDANSVPTSTPFYSSSCCSINRLYAQNPGFEIVREESVKVYLHIFIFYFFNLTYSRWTSSLPSCMWSLRIFPSLSGSRLTIFYRDTTSALLQLVNQWLNFTYSRSHAFRYGRNRKNRTHDFRTSRCVQFTY